MTASKAVSAGVCSAGCRRRSLKTPVSGENRCSGLPLSRRTGTVCSVSRYFIRKKNRFLDLGGSETTVGWWREPSCCANWVVLRYLSAGVLGVGLEVLLGSGGGGIWGDARQDLGVMLAQIWCPASPPPCV